MRSWRRALYRPSAPSNTGTSMAISSVGDLSTYHTLSIPQPRLTFPVLVADPDLSNPTRPRMERPLDTIRSFEAAIDSGYKRRSTYGRSESYNEPGSFAQSRRNSAYGEFTAPTAKRRSLANRISIGYSAPPQNRYLNSNAGGYYGGRGADGYGPGPGRPSFGAPRMQSEPYMQRPYPPHHGYHQSQDTMATGVTNGSDSTGPWANSTDPSSENSSIDKNYPSNGFGQNGHPPNGHGPGSSGPIPEDGAYPMKHGGAVQPPAGARRPIPLGNSGSSSQIPTTGSLPTQKRSEPEKRKGRLSRMFSKKGRD